MDSDNRPRPARPLSARMIVFGAAAIAVLGGGLLVLLLTLYGGGSPQDQAHLDAVRTAGAIVIGSGGAVALLLAARRQRTSELTLEHQLRVAAAAEHDAQERRITELYAKSAEQLGSDKAAVRLAGLYALERLGELSPAQRTTIVGVVCAYLRMPFVAPGERPLRDAEELEHAQYHERTQELQVRLTAQRILHRHRATGDRWWEAPIDLDGAHLGHAYLPGIGLAGDTLYRADLTGADLTDADLSGADLTAAVLRGAVMTGADLTRATLDDADLTGAVLIRAALTGVLLTGATWSAETVWPDTDTAERVAAASTSRGNGSRLVGELTLP